jgi:hypothetical protein
MIWDAVKRARAMRSWTTGASSRWARKECQATNVRHEMNIRNVRRRLFQEGDERFHGQGRTAISGCGTGRVHRICGVCTCDGDRCLWTAWVLGKSGESYGYDRGSQ